MAENSSVQLSRLVALVNFIAENPGVTVAQVADHFSRSVAQVRRDVSVLIDSGFDDLLPGRTLELDLSAYLEEGELWLRDPLGLESSISLSSQEFALLIYALTALSPSLSAAENALLPNLALKLVNSSEVGVGGAFFMQTVSALDEDSSVQKVLEAINDSAGLRFTYTDASGNVSRRQASPRLLRLARDGWLVEAIADTGERSFRLDRMTDVQVVAPATLRDSGREGLQAGASGELSGTQHAADQSQSGEPVVSVLLAPSAAWITNETPARNVRKTAEGLEATFVAWDPQWMRTELLLLAPYVEKTDPANVKEEASSYAHTALRQWERVTGQNGTNSGE